MQSQSTPSPFHRTRVVAVSPGRHDFAPGSVMSSVISRPKLLATNDRSYVFSNFLQCPSLKSIVVITLSGVMNTYRLLEFKL